VRLVYLDESGSDLKAPNLCVAGVIVHGDQQWPEIDRRILALIDKYIPESDRPGFVFHATDIFHGSKYFDRRKPEWANQERRIGLLNDLSLIIEDLHLPVVVGFYSKDKFGAGALDPGISNKEKGKLIHDVATLDCLLRVDAWLEKFAPNELATVVHEDGTPAKNLIKHSLRFARRNDLLDAQELQDAKRIFGLPLKRIIDTVHFAEKPDARPLQLADLAVFVLARMFKDEPVPAIAGERINKHMNWIYEHAAQVKQRMMPSGDHSATEKK